MIQNAKILEVFKSVQGEGKYLGAVQVFVRFFECNMHCVWCDTPGSIGDTTRNYKDVDLESLLNQIRPLYEGCHSVSITGGEPLLQADFLRIFLPKLQHEGMKVYLETNGVLPDALRQIIEWVDIIAMDIKLPSSTREKAFWDEHEDFLTSSLAKDVFIKMVITNDTSADDVYQAVDLVRRVNPHTLLIFQPNFLDMKSGVVDKCQEYQQYAAKYLRDTRVIPQTHKYMKLR